MLRSDPTSVGHPALIRLLCSTRRSVMERNFFQDRFREKTASEHPLKHHLTLNLSLFTWLHSFKAAWHTLPGELHPSRRALMGKPLQGICVVTGLRVALAKQAAPAHRQLWRCYPMPLSPRALLWFLVILYWKKMNKGCCFCSLPAKITTGHTCNFRCMAKGAFYR